MVPVRDHRPGPKSGAALLLALGCPVSGIAILEPAI